MNIISTLSNISGSLQLASQLAAPFTSYEDSLQKLSFGLGVITDTPSFLSRSESLSSDKSTKTDRFHSSMQITANVLHYTNVITQFFPTHPFLSLGLGVSESLAGGASFSLSKLTSVPQKIVPELLSNLTYIAVQFRSLKTKGSFGTTFYGSIQSHYELMDIHKKLVKIHPSANKQKLGYMTELPVPLDSAWGKFDRPNIIRLNKGRKSTDETTLLNIALHEFAHTFDNRTTIRHDERFQEAFRLIFLKAWAHDLLTKNDILRQEIFDSELRSDRLRRSTETAELKITRDEKLQEWYNRFKKYQKDEINPDNHVLQYSDLNESSQQDFKKYIQDLPLRNFSM